MTSHATIRDQASTHLEDGAVTPGYRANREKVIKLLNDALATELVCHLRYKRHYFMAGSLRAQAIASEFLEHAEQEAQHADKIAQRITQLGGEPDMNPDTLSKRSHAEYDDSTGLAAMVKADLIAERIAIDEYREMINSLGNDDPTTRRIIEEVLAQEEEHADELAGWLSSLGYNGEPKHQPRVANLGKGDAKPNLEQVVEVANELVTDEIHETRRKKIIRKD